MSDGHKFGCLLRQGLACDCNMTEPTTPPANTGELKMNAEQSDATTPTIKPGTCRVPMWMGGLPAGFCDKLAYGDQLPERYLVETRGPRWVSYCYGRACPDHGGPKENEVRIFQDGTNERGRPMWIAVLPDFINIMDSPAGCDADPLVAVKNLNACIATHGTGARSTGATP